MLQHLRSASEPRRASREPSDHGVDPRQRFRVSTARDLELDGAIDERHDRSEFEHAGVVQVEVAIKDPMAGAGHGMQHGQAGHHPAGDGMKSMKH